MIAADDGTASVVVAGTGIQLVDGVRAATVGVSGDSVVGAATITVDGFTLAAPGGEVGGLLHMRNSTADGLPAVAQALDDLAGGLLIAVNRVHASGSGLTMASSFTGSVTVANPAAMLNAAGLALTPTSGPLQIGVLDAAGNLVSAGSVSIDPAAMSLNDLAAAIDALPDVAASVTNGTLTVSAENPANVIAFGLDGSDSLVGLGVNGFFTGTDAHTIGVDPLIAADPRRIAAGRADLVTGRVSPGDNENAQALTALRNTRLFAGGSQTTVEFLGALGASVGTAARAAGAQADTLAGVIQATQAQQQSVSGVNVDEELADMIRYQHAYEASAKFVSTIDQMLETLLHMVG
jgi:flagellar hook-associated protein 1 FlgK